MTPRQRSVLVSMMALVAAGAVVYASLDALGSSLADAGAGEQFVENDGGSGFDELSIGASSTVPDLGDAASQATHPTLPSPAREEEASALPPAPSNTSTTAPPTTPSSETSEAPTSAEVTGQTAQPDGSPSSTEPAPDESSTTVPNTSPDSSTGDPTSTTVMPPGMNEVEREIFRLTNELRADPAGPHARQKPMPACVDDPFYGIEVDPATGHPKAVPALSLSEPVSLHISRPWAVDMDTRDTMSHRPNDSQLSIYGQLGIRVRAIGENVAWFQGYPDAQAARVHFEGWRESDSGHYCALMAGTFTHVGVGHHKGAVKSWAVQNFFQG